MLDEATAAAEARLEKTVDGRYKIVKVMASGSMGAVYQAERVPVGKIVAIKFLHASVAGDSEFQARFERETRVMSKLAHPNCVSVLDFGVWENEPYLVMDFVDGKTLRAIIDQGALPAPRALGLARQVAAGLAHAHDQGVIHRDIKPANIMIADEIGTGERVRILDFGLARLRGGGNVGRDATQTNVVVGTPNYMAPEQTVGGGLIDARTDIYALGVVLFEMIVGDRPFHAEETLQLLGMHRAAPIPRLHDRVKEGTELPDGLQELIDKAMAKSPDERFQTAIELAEAIDAVMAGNEETVPKSGPVVVAAAGKKKTANTAAVAPTMLDIESDDGGDDADDHEHDHEHRGRGVSWFGAMLLVGGIAAMAGYLIKRHNSSAPEVAAAGADAGQVVAHKPPPPPEPIDAPAKPIEAPVDALALIPPIDAGPEQGSGSDGDIEMDPSKAEDLDPGKGSATSAEEEAAGAPQTSEEIEKHAPAPPQLAKTLPEAVALIKAGQRSLALHSLRALEQKSPQSSYIPFLLGNLYYDQLWWGVALDEYAAAIHKNAAYRGNATLNRNVIRMLSSKQTSQKASNFLRGVIGHPALPYLKAAAVHEPNPVVRKKAGELARFIR
ncbi:MAG TPA: protein kinase [Kofleriaceae bacterium]|nr:protein kinase [Kofleriaceae bacterium]